MTGTDVVGTDVAGTAVTGAGWSGLGVGELLDAVQGSVAALAAATPTALTAVRVRTGDLLVEVEWAPPTTLPAPAVVPARAPIPVPAAAEEVPDDPGVHVVAPTVGVFYHSPQPGAAPFVRPDDLVHPGQQVGIVEAMKMMIPVEAEQAGQVLRMLVRDGEPVEHGQPLLALGPLPVA